MKQNHVFGPGLWRWLLEAAAAGGAIAVILAVAVLVLAPQARAESGDGQFESPSQVRRGSLLLRAGESYSGAPLLDTVVNIQVSGMISRTRVRQSFRNTGADWQEGIYVFPLPDDAAVDRLRMWIGERVIEGRIREREEARREYEEARREGKRASLVEQERPNIFTSSVANIGPGETVVVEIEYQHLVRYDRGRFELRFPMVVGPRYIPGSREVRGFAGSGWAVNTDRVPDAARITPPVLESAPEEVHNPVTLNVELDAGFTLAAVESPHHRISVEHPADTRYRVSLARGPVPADRDFVLNWVPAAGLAPQAALFTERFGNADYALIMLLPPERAVVAALRREIIFVIDTSGSMAGASIRQARAALDLAITRLRPDDAFNIIEFNSSMSRLFDRPQRAAPGVVSRARGWIAALDAGGGTEMAPAVHAALRESGTEYDIRQVVFLTDGSVGNEDELFRLIERERRDSRLFTIGIGSAPNSWFMRRAAEAGRGTFTWIGDTSEVRSAMEALFMKLEYPVLTDISVHWPRAAGVESWPQSVPDLYAGEPLLIAARAPSMPPRVELAGNIGDSVWQNALAIDGGRAHHGVHALWARRKIAALMGQRRDGAEGESVRAGIVETALEHHLVSRYTSLVAVDVTPARTREALLKRRNVAANLPAGWDYEKVFGAMPRTGTASRLSLLAGALFLATGIVLLVLYRRHPAAA